MRTLVHVSLGLLLGLFCVVAHAEYLGIGRIATDAEVKAWDTDVRPDFKGLPAGSGSVAQGETLWIARCSVCHGDFGEANHVYFPLVGSTTSDDIKTGRVAALKTGGSVRTTLAKVSTISTLWDYIHRAMPWDAPKSLSDDEVYAALAYLLNLGEIVPADFVLSDKNIAEVQQRMPNRDGMTREHGLWDVHGKPDTANKDCMKNCRLEAAISSALPEYAANSHGNLADQNRSFGAVRGVVTGKAADVSKPAVESAAPAVTAATDLITANGCTGCHGLDQKILGPGFKQVAAKYQSRADAKPYLAAKILSGGAGVWGAIPMPPQAALSKADAETIAAWIATGAKR